MPENEDPATEADSLPAKTKEWLEKNWLPQIHAVSGNRKPMKRILIGICVVPLIIVVTKISMLLMVDAAFRIQDGAILTTLVGLSVGSLQFLSKLQSCDDEIPKISLAVGIGRESLILKSVGNLSCYSTFKPHLEMLQNVIRKDG